MILDIARHKFYEALLVLLMLTGVMFAFAVALPDHVQVAEGNATPLATYLMRWSLDHGILAVMATSALYVCAALTLTRSTLRASLYPSATMAAMSLFPVLLLPVILMDDIVVSGGITLLAAISLSRLFRCFGPHVAPGAIFISLLSAGTLPLLDVSLSVVPLLLALVIVISRATFREAIIAIMASILPIFGWCYVVWCCGGSFVDEVLILWRLAIEGVPFAWLSAITIPLAVFLFFVALLMVAVVWRYIADRSYLSNAVRGVWATLFLLIAVVIVAFVLLPLSSSALLVVLMVTISAMLPLLFLRLGTMLSLTIYILLLAVAVVAAF